MICRPSVCSPRAGGNGGGALPRAWTSVSLEPHECPIARQVSIVFYVVT